MSEVISAEARFFLLSVLTGSAILCGYSLLRAVRREFPRGNFLTDAEDFLYWTGAGILCFLVTFWKNDGMLRGFSLVGLLIGSILYYHLLDRLVVHAVAKILHILCTPFRFVTKKIRFFARKVLKNCGKRVKMSIRNLKGKESRKGKHEKQTKKKAPGS